MPTETVVSESIIHADIFFFISTISLVLITTGIVIAFVYGIRILRDVREITDKTRAEWDEVLADSRELRGALREEGMKWKHVIDLVRNFFVGSRLKTASKSGKKTKNDKKISESE